jgi:SAM-dependent methyltransferase
MAWRNGQLHQRDQPPEPSRPLRVGVHTEAAVSALTLEQRSDPWSVGDLLPGLPHDIAARRSVKDINQREIANRWIPRGQKPRDDGILACDGGCTWGGLVLHVGRVLFVSGMNTETFDPNGYKAGQRRDWTEAAAGWRKWWSTMEAAFGPVGQRLVQLAGVRPGHRVLDVATGIGEPALTAARVVGPTGRVVGTDISSGMLELARERAAELGLENVQFLEMDAEALDLPEGSFDASLCRFGLMFLPDVDRALEGVRKVIVPGGRFAAAVWGPPERVPMGSATYRAIARVLDLPPPAAGTPGLFSLAGEEALAGKLRSAGFADVRTETLVVHGEFASLGDYIRYLQEVAAPIKNILKEEPPERRAEVWQAVADANQQFVVADGKVDLSSESILVAGRR